MEPPAKPDESECCGSGCKPCIFDVYEEQLKKWKSNQCITQSKALNQTKYLPFLITDVETSGSLLTFQFQAVSLLTGQNCTCVENAQPDSEYRVLEEFLNVKPGEYLIMKGMHGSDTISRSYTPVLNEENFEKGTFTIVVSLLPGGKMSEFLAKLKMGDVVFWRGPYREFTYRANSYKSVLLIGGGTGIVPLYNISKSIVEDDADDTLVNVMGSFKSTDCIVLRNEFGKLRDYWNFRISFYISQAGNCSNLKANYNEILLFNRLSESAIEEEVNKCGKDTVFVIVCGPQGFNDFVKGTLKNCGVDDGNIFIFWYALFFIKSFLPSPPCIKRKIATAGNKIKKIFCWKSRVRISFLNRRTDDQSVISNKREPNREIRGLY